HSLSGDPVYVSIYDLHVGQGSAVLGRGTGIAGITEDLEGTPRPPIPTMGSDEEPLPPVSGTLTIKPDGTGNYRNFVECFEMLRVQTVTGPVTVLADPGTYIEERTVPVSSIPGASASNPIVVKPASGTVVVKNAANQDVFTFDGASFVTLESLELTGASTGHGVCLKNGATSNTFKKLYIHDLQGTRAGIFADTGTSLNAISQCKIFGAKYALQVEGSDGNIISNNMLRGGTDQTVVINQSAGTQFLHNTLRSETTGKPDRLLQFQPATGDTGNVFKNNVFALVSATSTNRCFQVASTSAAFTADNNDYYIENLGQVGYYDGAARVTLADWKNAGHGQDANSVSDNPSLV
ncbi:MAG: right-handed parallel beta-helix repeat-containing protein, partial [Planctomycetota bacterium]